MHNTIYNIIRSLPLFAEISDTEVAKLLEAGQLKQFAKEEPIFAHGDKVTHFYLIITGNIQMFRTTPDGNEKTIEVLKGGQTMCEGEILDSCHGHRLNAVAVSDVQVMQFPAPWLKETARQNGTFALNLLSLIAQQAHMAEVEAEHQASMSAAQLVACFLQRMCILYNFDPKGFDLPYSKSLIASRLGMELETLSRAISKLKNQGITVNGTKVSITNLKEIEHYVCGFCSIADNCTTHKEISLIIKQ